MNFLDLRTAWSDVEVHTDVCIIGSGPAGLTIARELIPTGASILVVESGALEQEDETEALSQIESLGYPGSWNSRASGTGCWEGRPIRGRAAVRLSTTWISHHGPGFPSRDGRSGATRWPRISIGPRKLSRPLADPALAMRLAVRVPRISRAVESGLRLLPLAPRRRAHAQIFGPMTQRPGHVHLPNMGQLGFFQAKSSVNSRKIRRILGYRPKFDFESGMQATARYLADRYSRKEPLV